MEKEKLPPPAKKQGSKPPVVETSEAVAPPPEKAPVLTPPPAKPPEKPWYSADVLTGPAPGESRLVIRWNNPVSDGFQLPSAAVADVTRRVGFFTETKISGRLMSLTDPPELCFSPYSGIVELSFALPGKEFADSLFGKKRFFSSGVKSLFPSEDRRYKEITK